MGIKQPVKRQDAYAKVTGRARFVEDLLPAGALVGYIVHSTVANGFVKSIDTMEAEASEGVVKILTCFDVPHILHSTAGHAHSLNPEFADIADRLMLESHVRQYGDNIAVIVADSKLSAEAAEKKLKITYEAASPVLDTENAVNTAPLHGDVFDGNAFAQFNFTIHNDKLTDIGTASMKGNWEAVQTAAIPLGAERITEDFELVPVHACHIENPVCFAYMEGEQITVVTATQVPHTVCRIVANVAQHPISKVHVIKPYVGGSFGNKQDLSYEPLAAYLTKQLGGRCVCFFMSREESFVNSRTRHGMKIHLESVFKGMDIIGRYAFMDSDQGAYSAHGHSIAINAITDYAYIYPSEWCIADTRSVYTNKPTASAMRGYGIPQIVFAVESHMDDLAIRAGVDPIELRLKNMVRGGYIDPFNGNVCRSYGLPECISKGMELIGWKEKRTAYPQDNCGTLRRGVGMAMFIYPTGLAPFSLESSACRIVLTQDGGATVHVGATELGQGSDTAFAQIAAEVLKIPQEKVLTVARQDTDSTPYDNGAYASRQTFVTGRAVKQTAEMLCNKILRAAARRFGTELEELCLTESGVKRKDGGELLATLSDIAMHSLFCIEDSEQLSAESTACVHDNAYSFGTCFADIEVDVSLGKISINQLVLVHDSGTIINPQIAESQVMGGAVMGMGYALTEEMLFDPETGRMYNNNLLDYKIPTAADIPEIRAEFVETYEPKGPFGNKSLGEPPVLAVAPAIRNALLHATGIGINRLPMKPEILIREFVRAGLIERRS